MTTTTDAAAIARRLFDEGWTPGTPGEVFAIVDPAYASNEEAMFWRSAPVRPSRGWHPGMTSMARHLGSYTSEWDRLRFEVDRTTVDGDTVVVRWRAFGVSRTETMISRSGRRFPVAMDGSPGVSL